jgi:hypothetical protein
VYIGDEVSIGKKVVRGEKNKGEEKKRKECRNEFKKERKADYV